MLSNLEVNINNTWCLVWLFGCCVFIACGASSILVYVESTYSIVDCGFCGSFVVCGRGGGDLNPRTARSDAIMNVGRD